MNPNNSYTITRAEKYESVRCIRADLDLIMNATITID